GGGVVASDGELAGWGGRRGGGDRGGEDEPSRRGRVRWARASTGRCVRTGGLGSGVRQLRGITFGWSFVQRDLWESGARRRCIEGKERQSLAAAGLIEGAEHTRRRAASRRL